MKRVAAGAHLKTAKLFASRDDDVIVCKCDSRKQDGSSFAAHTITCTRTLEVRLKKPSIHKYRNCQHVFNDFHRNFSFGRCLETSPLSALQSRQSPDGIR